MSTFLTTVTADHLGPSRSYAWALWLGDAGKESRRLATSDGMVFPTRDAARTHAYATQTVYEDALLTILDLVLAKFGTRIEDLVGVTEVLQALVEDDS